MYPAGKAKGLPSINAGMPLSLSTDKFPNARSKSSKKYYDTYMNNNVGSNDLETADMRSKYSSLPFS